VRATSTKVGLVEGARDGYPVGPRSSLQGGAVGRSARSARPT
jgi:hypothetical protein